jgi:hypothetical protein
MQRQRHAGKQDHRQGKEWQLVEPTHFVGCFAHSIWFGRDYGRAAGRSQFEKQIMTPAVVLGNVQRGSSSTPSDEEGFISGV